MPHHALSWAAALALSTGTAIAPATALAAEDTETVTVTLSNFAFTPETITLQQGKAVHLVLVNESSSGHSFAAQEFFAAAKMDDAARSRIKKGRIEVKKGATVTLDLVAPAPGTYDLHCSHFLHEGFGMTGKIIVE